MDLFNSPETIDQIKFEDLVGEGKRYADADALAKAKAHSDAHIARLEAENAEKAQKLATATAVEDAIKKLQASNANGNPNLPTGGQVTQTPATAVPNPANLTLEDVEKLLNQKRQEEIVSKNLDTVSDALVKVAGDMTKAQEFILARSKELGISPVKLRELGAESPTALLKLLNVDSYKPQAPISPMERKTTNLPTGGNRELDMTQRLTSADYARLKKENPKLYSKPETQQKMLEDKMYELKKQRNLI